MTDIFILANKIQSLVEGVKELQHKFVVSGRIDQNTFDKFVSADASPTKKYLGWMIREYLKSPEKNEATAKLVIEYCTWFEDYKDIKNLPEKDLYKYSMETLKPLYAETQTSIVRYEPKAKTPVVYEKGDVKVLKINTHEQSRTWGLVGVWCITQPDPRWWTKYTRKDKLTPYFVIKGSEKICVMVHPDKSLEGYDKENRPAETERVMSVVLNDWKAPKDIFKYNFLYKRSATTQTLDDFYSKNKKTNELITNDKYSLFYIESNDYSTVEEWYNINYKDKALYGATFNGIFDIQAGNILTDSYVIMEEGHKYNSTNYTMEHPSRDVGDLAEFTEFFGFHENDLQETEGKINYDIMNEEEEHAREQAHDEVTAELKKIFDEIAEQGYIDVEPNIYQADKKYYKADVLTKLSYDGRDMPDTLQYGKYSQAATPKMTSEEIHKEFNEALYGGILKGSYESDEIKDYFYSYECEWSVNEPYCGTDFDKEVVILILIAIGVLTDINEPQLEDYDDEEEYKKAHDEWENSRPKKDVQGQTFFDFKESANKIKKNMELFS